MRDMILVLSFTCLLQLHLFAEGLNPESYSNNYDVSKPSRRIVNGVPADLFDFSFVVGVTVPTGQCTGSIIASEWVITAGHCIHNLPCPGRQIHPAAWPPSEFVHAVECVTHPDFLKTQIFQVDLSLIKIQPSFQLDDQTRIIPLIPSRTMLQPGTPAIIAGYGQTETDDFPNVPLRADVLIEDQTVCNRKYKADTCQSDPQCPVGDIGNQIFCTQGQGPKAGGTCYGDSGGPVLVNGYLAGVSVFGLSRRAACATGAASFHVDIFHQLQWIRSYIGTQ